MIQIMQPGNFASIKIPWINGEPEMWRVVEVITRGVIVDGMTLDTPLSSMYEARRACTIREFLEEYSMQCVLRFGEYKNSTLHHVIMTDPEYFGWLLRESRLHRSLKGFYLLNENAKDYIPKKKAYALHF